MASDYADQVAQELVHQLRRGTAPWIEPRAAGEQYMPYNPSTGADYRGGNAIWLLSRAESQGYDDARWLTYQQAQEQGGQVRKGEKGTLIQFWQHQGMEPVRDAAGNPTVDSSGTPVREMVRYEQPRLISATVFNAAQIDGLPAAEPRPALSEKDRHARAEAILTGSGITLQGKGHRPRYHLATDCMTLADPSYYDSGDSYYEAALHELGHATGHPSRLNRDLRNPLGSEEHAREELRAAISSLVLGSQLTIGHDASQSDVYIERWIEVLEEDPREIFRAAADAEKIAELVRSFDVERVQAVDETHDQPVHAAPAPPVMIQQEHPSMTESADRTYLAVSYREKDAARQAGARWDQSDKAWYVPAGVALDAFERWLPSKIPVHVDTHLHPRDAFANALRDAGLRLNGAPVMDGTMQRVPVEGDRHGERSGAYKGYLDGRPAGFVQNFKTGGQKIYWKANAPATSLTEQDRAQLAAEAAQNRQRREQQREEMYERAGRLAALLWEGAGPVSSSQYLTAKGVTGQGLKEGQAGQYVITKGEDGSERRKSLEGLLIVPVHGVDGTLASLQFIQPDGAKMFLPNGRTDTGHFAIGDVTKPGPLLIAEGYATAATVHELTGAPVIVAFNAGNIGKVADLYRSQHPDRAIYIAGDSDPVGRAKAEEAAAAVRGGTLVPFFPTGVKGSDWNDLKKEVGHDVARITIQSAMTVAERQLACTREVETAIVNSPTKRPATAPTREAAELER